jgi:hypothetical protein
MLTESKKIITGSSCLFNPDEGCWYNRARYSRIRELSQAAPVTPSMLLSPNKLLTNSMSHVHDHPASKSNTQSITGISTSCLRFPDDLDHLTSSQTQISRDRITQLDSRQLCLLQAVSFQQFHLLLSAQQYMLGD